MADNSIADAFEQHLRSLSQPEWDALVARVRTPKHQPQTPLPGEQEQHQQVGSGRNEGLAEAKRRGYID